METMPTWLTGLGILTLSFVLGLGGLALTHPARRRALKLEHNDVNGQFFAAVAVVYAVLLAFVVFAVWERFSSASQSVTNEAAALVATYREAQALPEPMRTDATDALRRYARSIQTEWRTHGTVAPHSTPDPLNAVWNAYRAGFAAEGGAAGANVGVNPAQQLEHLEQARHMRHLASEDTLPDVFWWVLLGGGVTVVVASYFFCIESIRLHAGMTGMLSLMVGALLFLILSLNFPFTGQVHVGPEPLEHAIYQFDALDRQG